jgi:hypothetical protein
MLLNRPLAQSDRCSTRSRWTRPLLRQFEKDELAFELFLELRT